MVKSNQLAAETSPYLQQHAHQPVDWHSWNEKTLNKAKQENKPILLSIGYAACHWCHVMSHESFDDEETARIMNELFINVKVDREERPDLDKVYQTAHYFLTQSQGGWPLTVFLAPDDLTPFFSGTYFPNSPRHQLPAFKDVLRTLAEIYKKNPHDIKQQSNYLLQLLNEQSSPASDATLSDEPFHTAQQFLEKAFDAKYGGFGSAPKFPHPPMLEWLVKNQSTLAHYSLMRMAEGGIYDQLQGGFFRYTVDEKWEIPHFEKMLYDNAQLLHLYSLAAKAFDEPYFETIAKETANWIIEKMQSPAGGYYASLDADSEGEEGKYYAWNKFEISEQLPIKESQLADVYFNLSGTPNFENKWHLHIANSLPETAKKLHLSIESATHLLASIKEKLLAVRDKRIPPSQDQKILTAWNGLMIKGMLVAGDLFKEERYLISARQAFQCLQRHAWRDNQLFVSSKEGKAFIPGYLDDYAFLLDALVTSLQIIWNPQDLQFAIQLADALIANFSDPIGGFFFTSTHQEQILYRPKSMMDEAIPSGNAIAARALLTLGSLLGNLTYLTIAEQTLKAAWSLLVRFPSEHCNFLLALNDYLNPPALIILRGPDRLSWKTAIKQVDKSAMIFAISDEEKHLSDKLALFPNDEKTHALICKQTHCLPISHDLETLLNQLNR